MSLYHEDNCAEISKCTMTWRDISNTGHCLRIVNTYFATKLTLLVTWNSDSDISDNHTV